MQRTSMATIVILVAYLLTADGAFAQGRPLSTRSRFHKQQNTLSPYLELLNSNTTGLGYYRRIRMQDNQRAINQQLNAGLLAQQQLLSSQQGGQVPAGTRTAPNAHAGSYLSPSGVRATFQNYRGYFGTPGRSR